MKKEVPERGQESAKGEKKRLEKKQNQKQKRKSLIARGRNALWGQRRLTSLLQCELEPGILGRRPQVEPSGLNKRRQQYYHK